jgi:hypothetical protein
VECRWRSDQNAKGTDLFGGAVILLGGGLLSTLLGPEFGPLRELLQDFQVEGGDAIPIRRTIRTTIEQIRRFLGRRYLILYSQERVRKAFASIHSASSG